MTYQPIEHHGIIGNMRTAALVGMNGSIDWFCFPRFDSPSVFAALLDDHKGGSFQIAPAAEADDALQRQFYWPDTNVLVTRFVTPDGIGEIVDYMPVGGPPEDSKIIRTVHTRRGTMRYHLRCQPAFDYARADHVVQHTEYGAAFHSDALSLGLAASIDLEQRDNAVVADFTVEEGSSVTFTLGRVTDQDSHDLLLAEHEAHRLFEKTVAYWHRWLGKCTYTGRWREMIYRSALTLKLLIYEPTGAMVAAPTCSLPEAVGGERNWDYRYTWIRDTAFALYALIKIGYDEEAAAFMEWIKARCRELDDGGSLQPLYTLDGQPHVAEAILDHLDGYQGSRPVRLGNAAYEQFQLDIYGPLLDSIYLYNKHCQFITYELWAQLERLLNWVCDHWQDKDRGIWEMRGDPQHFVYSKLMCWVALDRGLRLADKRGFPADRRRWIDTRDQIYGEIIEKGWDTEHKAYMQYYGGDGLDAANLIMPLVFFTSPGDTRFQHTLHATMQPPETGGLMSGEMIYRYNMSRTDDGLSGEEGTFNMCTFWLVEALTRNGHIDRARLIYERMLGYANHVGLYAEQTGLRGEALGNFPQALTHLSLISAALSLDKALASHQAVFT